MASISCENCGFKGAALPSGACPRCGAAAAGDAFRVPPLPAPSAGVASDIEPDRHAPPGGYLDLDLGESGKLAESVAAAAPPRERRRTGRTGPAFAAVAPKQIPGSPRSVLPIFIAVGVGCLALILVGVLVSHGGGSTPAAAPARVAAPAPAPAPPAAAPDAPAEGSPVAAPSTVLAAPALAAPEPAAPTRPQPRPEPRAERGARRTSPAQPARTTSRPARPEREAARPEPAAAPAPAPQATVAQAPVLPPPPVVSAPSAPAQIEDAPRYPAEGFKRPQMTEPHCVQNAIRAPRDLADRVTGPVTIRFAVGPEGDVSLFQIVGEVPDPRLPTILENAVRSCTFSPAADVQGKPIRMWMTIPIRFAR